MSSYANFRLVEGNCSWVSQNGLRKVGSGDRETSVFDFGIISSQRVRGDNGEWTDGEPDRISVTVWGRLAENVAKSIDVGTRVIVSGEVRMKAPYVNKEKGIDNPASEYINADCVGLSLEFASGKLERNPSNGGGSSASASRKTTSAPAKKAAAKPPVEIDDSDLDLDLDDSDDIPF